MRVVAHHNRTIPMSHQLTEIVERKGKGHPDTLADAVAETISRTYARYCLERFDCILHHNVDKVALLGGESRAGFGYGEIVHPMRIMINGRMSTAFGEFEIPCFEIAATAAKEYISSTLKHVKVEQDIMAYDFLNRAGGPPHKGSEWFRPKSKKSLPELYNLVANDTVCCVGFWPFSNVENLVLSIEEVLFSNGRPILPCVGNDIKVMATRISNTISVTACIPFIGSETPNLSFYRDTKAYLHQILMDHFREALEDQFEVSLAINTRDNDDRNDYYVLATGTALESGDEGLVGRGNRSSGFISTTRPYSIEAPSGKNPVYHAGKVYDVAARWIAKDIATVLGGECTVYIVTHNGATLSNPDLVMVDINNTNFYDEHIINNHINNVLNNLNNITDAIVSGQVIFGW